MSQKDSLHLAQEFLARMGGGAEPAFPIGYAEVARACDASTFLKYSKPSCDGLCSSDRSVMVLGRHP
jgi:hypothetical protein